MKIDVMIATFPFGNAECPDSRDWVEETLVKAARDPRIGNVCRKPYDDTPITMTRNRAMYDAAEKGVDVLFMLDSDMHPDLCLHRPYYSRVGAKPFYDVALDFYFNRPRPGPFVLGVPYCGPPPHENVYVFKPSSYESNHPNFDFRLEQYTREEAARLGGVQEVMALPTGLVMIDMACFPKLRDPFFDYEYRGDGEKCLTCGQRHPGPRSEKASTEDVYWSRNLALAGVRQYCAWDCWAGHWKRKLVGPPQLLTVDRVIEQYREAILRGDDAREREVVVGGMDALTVKKPTPEQQKAVAAILAGRKAARESKVDPAKMGQMRDEILKKIEGGAEISMKTPPQWVSEAELYDRTGVGVFGQGEKARLADEKQRKSDARYKPDAVQFPRDHATTPNQWYGAVTDTLQNNKVVFVGPNTWTERNSAFNEALAWISERTGSGANAQAPPTAPVG